MKNKDNWEVICTGNLKQDHTIEIVIDKIIQILGVNKDQSKALIKGGSSALKNRLDQKSALQLQQALEDAGVEAKLKEPTKIVNLSLIDQDKMPNLALEKQANRVNSSIKKQTKMTDLSLDHLSLEPLYSGHSSPSPKATTTKVPVAAATRVIAAKVIAAKEAAARETVAPEIEVKARQIEMDTRPPSPLFDKLKNNKKSLLTLIIILASANYVFDNYSHYLDADITPAATAQIEALETKLSYPKTNKQKLLRLLQSQNYAELEYILVELQSNVSSDISWQSSLRNSIIAVSEKDKVTVDMLNHWIKSTQSSFSYLARGSFYVNQGVATRGSKLANKTSNKKFITRNDLYLLAYADLIKAKSIDSSLLHTYSLLIQINVGEDMADSAIDVRKHFLEEAIAINPAGFHYRSVYMEHLKPKWGGSWEKMDRFVSETVNYLPLNPRLNILQGYVPAEKANIALSQKIFTQCITHYTEALEYGIEPDWLRKRAYCFFDNGNNEKALTDINLFFSYSNQANDYDKELKRYLTKKLKN